MLINCGAGQEVLLVGRKGRLLLRGLADGGMDRAVGQKTFHGQRIRFGAHGKTVRDKDIARHQRDEDSDDKSDHKFNHNPSLARDQLLTKGLSAHFVVGIAKKYAEC
ncbi:MAG: hypothetical protein ACR2FX_06140 [Chthoniobacterales bacterium]